MYSTALSAIFALLAIRPALADFKVFCGTDGNALDGVSANECHFFNNPPDCADFENSVSFVIQKDVSFDGVACDGCDISKAPQDWDVTRLEIHEPNYFEGGVDHFTIYKGDSDYGVYDTDMNRIGTCLAPADPQIVNCQTPISGASVKNVFDCTLGIIFNDSPN